MSELLTGRGPDDGEEPEDWLFRKALAGNVAQVPLFGPAAAAALEASMRAVSMKKLTL